MPSRRQERHEQKQKTPEGMGRPKARTPKKRERPRHQQRAYTDLFCVKLCCEESAAIKKALEEQAVGKEKRGLCS
jgi:hypothetical protein